MAFALQKFLSFRRYQLIIVALSVCATGVIFRKWFPLLIHSRLLPTFLSMRFSVTGVMVRYLIHLDLSFTHEDKYGSICILLHFDFQLFQHHLLKMLSFSHCIILASLSKLRCSYICGSISGSSISSAGIEA